MAPVTEPKHSDQRQRTRDIIRLAKRVYGLRAYAGTLKQALGEAETVLEAGTPILLLELEGSPPEAREFLKEILEESSTESVEQCVLGSDT